eukprot:COSAG06_NODE_897_length_11651_cov_7.190439_11_plen_240_part_00
MLRCVSLLLVMDGQQVMLLATLNTADAHLTDLIQQAQSKLEPAEEGESVPHKVQVAANYEIDEGMAQLVQVRAAKDAAVLRIRNAQRQQAEEEAEHRRKGKEESDVTDGFSDKGATTTPAEGGEGGEGAGGGGLPRSSNSMLFRNPLSEDHEGDTDSDSDDDGSPPASPLAVVVLVAGGNESDAFEFNTTASVSTPDKARKQQDDQDGQSVHLPSEQVGAGEGNDDDDKSIDSSGTGDD